MTRRFLLILSPGLGVVGFVSGIQRLLRCRILFLSFFLWRSFCLLALEIVSGVCEYVVAIFVCFVLAIILRVGQLHVKRIVERRGEAGGRQVRVTASSVAMWGY